MHLENIMIYEGSCSSFPKIHDFTIIAFKKLGRVPGATFQLAHSRKKARNRKGIMESGMVLETNLQTH